MNYLFWFGMSIGMLAGSTITFVFALWLDMVNVKKQKNGGE